MPQRSTEFQRLVFLVKQQFAEGAVVTESKMLLDRILNKTTEVDTCIETTVAGHDLIVSLECREHKRRCGKNWVQEMYTKHQSLPTSLLVLASRSGFAPEALKLAVHYGIETVKLDEIDADAITGLLKRIHALCMKTISLTGTRFVIQLEKTDVRPKQTVIATPDNNLVSEDGQHLGLVQNLVELLLRDERIALNGLQDGIADHKSFNVEWHQHEDAIPQYCLQESDTGMIRRIEQMDISGSFEVLFGRFQMKHGKLGDVQVSWSTGEYNDKKALLVVTEKNGKPKLSLHLGKEVLTSGAMKIPDKSIIISTPEKQK